MKKCLCTVLCVLLGAGLLAGCGTELEADTSTVYVSNKGAVTSLEVETFGEDYYDAAELGAYVNDAVDAYAAEHGKGAVKVEELTVENGSAKLRMNYKTTEDYTKFNGIELYQGKVIETLAAGYVYEGDFVKVEDGKVTGTATKQEIYKEEGLKAVIIRANMDVKVAGKICYVSGKNVKLTGADSVSIREGYNLLKDAGLTAEADKNPAVADEAINGTEVLGDNTEMLADSTEAMQEHAELPEEETIIDDGAFETEVYTYIVYK